MNNIVWFAVSHDIIEDPKLKIIASRLSIPKPFVQLVWLYILRQASASETRGIIPCLNCEEAEISTDIPISNIVSIINAFIQREMIDCASSSDTINGVEFYEVFVKNFTKWQSLSDEDVKRARDREYQRKSRQKKKYDAIKDADVSDDVRNKSDMSDNVATCQEKSPTYIQTYIHTDKISSCSGENPERDKVEKKPPKYSKEDYALAKEIADKISDISPHTKTNLESSADTIRLMREIDHIPRDKILAVFMWAHQDSFWRKNILSVAKLREQFGQLDTKMRDSPPPQQGKVKHTGFTPEYYSEGIT